MTRHYSRSTDANQASIVDDLRRRGASVLLLHRLGKGAPDLLVAMYRFRTTMVENLLVEVKRDRKAPLTPDEKLFRDSWAGPRITASTSDEIVEWFNAE